MTEIVAILEIIILLTCAVYVAFRVAKAITQKKPQEPEKETLCDTCKHLVLKGCDIISTDGKYICEVYNGFFCKAPEYCKGYSRREEHHDKTTTN